MKAIEILKAITENEGTHLWLDDGSGYPKSYIYESIKELEELQQSNQDLLNTVIEAQKMKVMKLLKEQLFKQHHRMVGAVLLLYFMFTYIFNVILVK